MDSRQAFASAAAYAQCFCALAVLVPAHASAQSTAAATTANVSIDGRVSNGVTGDPIAGAEVRLTIFRSAETPTEITLETHSDGAFHADGLNPGMWVIRVHKNGFSSANRNGAVKFVNTGENSVVQGLAFQLVPDSTLSGRITDPDGKPVAGANVSAYRQVPSGATEEVRKRSSATSAKDGSYTIAGLPPGTYYVAAEQQDTGVNTWYPSSIEFESAGDVSITPGVSPTGIDIVLKHAPTYRIRGRLAENIPSGRIFLSPKPGSLDETVSVRRNSDGTFESAPLISGSYTLRVMRGRALVAQMDIDVSGADVSGVVVNPAAPISLTGTVTMAGAALAQTVIVTAHPLVRRVALPDVTARVSGAAGFTLQNLQPVAYVFHVYVAAAGYYVESATLDGQDVLNRSVDFSSVGGGTLAITISTGAANITGSVLSASGVGYIGVVVVPEHLAPDGRNESIVYSGSDGHYTVQNLAPGTYRLFAVQRPDPSWFQSERFLQSLAWLATSVSVSANETGSADLSLISPELVEQAGRDAGFEEF